MVVVCHLSIKAVGGIMVESQTYAKGAFTQGNPGPDQSTLEPKILCLKFV